MLIKNARIFSEKGLFFEGSLEFEGETILSLKEEAFTKNSPSDTQNDTRSDVLDAGGLFLVPALVDIHFHGADGYDFCDGTPESLSKIASYEASRGVGAICPATMTYSLPILSDVMKNAAKYKAAFRAQTEAELVGINMEGPFISHEKRGAQNPDYISPPDVSFFRTLQECSGGLIRLLDLAPETENAIACIKELKDEVSISLAHTTADYDTASRAFLAGARQVTHLYNAMPPFLHRSPGVIGAAFDHARFVELICDGIHLHPSVVRASYALFGKDRIVMISDSMRAAGLEDGEYSLGGQRVCVKEKYATLEDGTLAGSASDLMDCLRAAVKEMGIPLEDALLSATLNPARAIGIEDAYGSIAPGKKASFLLLEEDLSIAHIFLRGQRLRPR